MINLVVSQMSDNRQPVEVVERKGPGHPDSICDALAQNLSRNLCRYYLDHFGGILHHNVDKALLCGGIAAPAFGGGEVLAPAEIYLAGRAVTEIKGKRIPLDDIAIEGSRAWLRQNMHALDADRHVRLHHLLRPGSLALGQLFARPSDGRKAPFANDSSFGAGHAPLSPLERLVLEADRILAGPSRDHPAWGEDIKVMAVRRGDAVSVTIACAMIGRYLSDIDSYIAATEAIRHKIETLAAECGFAECQVRVNAADDLAAGSVYLTVTGTSAEAGDDGQVGRGNRVNGLITPYRPMSLEAAAGKNPVSHVGMIYNVLAREIAETIVSTVAEVSAAECFLVSEIGSPLTDPKITHVRLSMRDGSPPSILEGRIGDIVEQKLDQAGDIVDRFVAGSIRLF